MKNNVMILYMIFTGLMMMASDAPKKSQEISQELVEIVFPVDVVKTVLSDESDNSIIYTTLYLYGDRGIHC